MFIGGGPGGLPLAINVEPMFMLEASPRLAVGACTGGPPLLGGAPLLGGTPPPFDALTCIAQALFSPDGPALLGVGCDQALPPALDDAAPAASNDAP